MEGEKLVMSLGFSHKVEVLPPKGIKVSLDEKEKNTIHVFGIDKHLV
jgi:large subunit ribosomal protein L6